MAFQHCDFFSLFQKAFLEKKIFHLFKGGSKANFFGGSDLSFGHHRAKNIFFALFGRLPKI